MALRFIFGSFVLLLFPLLLSAATAVDSGCWRRLLMFLLRGLTSLLWGCVPWQACGSDSRLPLLWLMKVVYWLLAICCGLVCPGAGALLLANVAALADAGAAVG